MRPNPDTPGDMPKNGSYILIVEDDPKTSDILRLYLEESGFTTRCISHGNTALRVATEHPPDLVVLDLMLPGMDGWSVCRHLREESDVPILILSARQEEEDRLLGLGLGGDDYVVKPFSPREIVLRVQAILRRFQHSKTAKPETSLGQGAIRVNLAKHQVTAHGREVELTPSEYKILLAFLRAPGKTFERGELLDHLYPVGNYVVPKVIDVHIGKLRQKIEPKPSQPCHLLTVRGFGYRFVNGAE